MNNDNLHEISGELKLPDGLTSIDDNAFYDCRELSGELNLPAGLTDIGKRAFSYCEGLSGLKLPESLENIGYESFEGCNEIIKIIFYNPQTENEDCLDRERSSALICGYKDSTAEAYANNCGFVFEELTATEHGD